MYQHGEPAFRKVSARQLRSAMIRDAGTLVGCVAQARPALKSTPLRSDLISLGGQAMVGDRPIVNLCAASSAPSMVQATDIGSRLADLAPMMRSLAGKRIELDLEIGYPNAHARIDVDAFDEAIFDLVANACAADAHVIIIRNRRVAGRHWILICDDGSRLQSRSHENVPQNLDNDPVYRGRIAHINDFVRAAHGQLRVRNLVSGGTLVAIILPTVLSVAVSDRRAPPRSAFAKPKEKSHEEIRQRVAG